jgi:TolA-binding protein
MSKTIIAAVLFSFCAGPAAAVEKPQAQAPAGTGQAEVRKDKESWKSWYDNFYKGLRSKVQKKFHSKARVSAVAAVRGDKTGGDASELYWKGGVSEQALKKSEAERKALGDAVELVVNGDAAAGRGALEKFIKENPESVYLPDAREALGMLPAEEPAPAPGTPAKPAAPVKDAAPGYEPAPDGAPGTTGDGE